MFITTTGAIVKPELEHKQAYIDIWVDNCVRQSLEQMPHVETHEGESKSYLLHILNRFFGGDGPFCYVLRYVSISSRHNEAARRRIATEEIISAFDEYEEWTRNN